VKRKRAFNKNLSYRPLKPAKEKAIKTNYLNDLSQSEEESEINSNCSAEDLIFDGI
jgi:hypothetical protein